MADPDQEEIRRKRLARLGGATSASNSAQGGPQRETDVPVVSERNDNRNITAADTSNVGLVGNGNEPLDRGNQTSTNFDTASPAEAEEMNIQASDEDCKEQASSLTSEMTGTRNKMAMAEESAAVASVQRSDSSTAMDVSFTPSTPPPKALTSGKGCAQQIESCSGQANNSSTSQKSQSPILTDFDSGIETMDIDNEPSVHTANFVNPPQEEVRHSLPEISVGIDSSMTQSSPNKLNEIHSESKSALTHHSLMSPEATPDNNYIEGSSQTSIGCHGTNSPEKRKRTSSSTNYDITEDHILDSLQNIFGCRVISASEEVHHNTESTNYLLHLPECTKLIVERRQELTLKLNSLDVPKDMIPLDYREIISDILTEVLTGMTKNIYPPKVTNSGEKQMSSMKENMFRYLVKCYDDINLEERKHKKKTTSSPLADAFSASRKGIIMYTCLVLSGTFETEIQITESAIATPFFEPLLKQTLPSGFLVDMINYAAQEFGGGEKEIFEPLLRSLVLEVRSSNLVDLGNYRHTVNVLIELSEISIEKNRPICQIMTEMTEWLPAEISAGSGKADRGIFKFSAVYLGVDYYAF